MATPSQSQLTEEEERVLTSVLANHTEVSGVIDSDQTIMWVGRNLPGLTSADVIGCHPSEFVPDDSKEFVRTQLTKAQRSRTTQSFEVPVFVRNNEHIYEWRVSPIGNDNRLFYLGHDITDVRRRELSVPGEILDSARQVSSQVHTLMRQLSDLLETTPAGNEFDEPILDLDRLMRSSYVASLSEREVAILRTAILHGKQSIVATVLGISPNTLRNHMGTIYSKLHVGSFAELIAVIARLGR